tara:strand:+ start:97 stop:720 length:624 start_codon:yes stop_codon:yes gene_type:complete
MYNNFDLVLNIWKRQYETDFELLDTPQERIEFLKDLLKKNDKNIIELKKGKLPIAVNQTKLSILEDLHEFILDKLASARLQKRVWPTYETPEAQKIPTKSSEDKTSSKIVESKHDDLDILLMDIAEKEPDLSGGEVWNLLCREMVRKTCKYDHDRILLQKSYDDSDTIIWKSGRGKSNETRLTKDYLERNKWPAAKKWAKENHNKPS